MAFTSRYHDEWEEDLKRLGLFGPNFDTFWRPIEEFIEETPNVGHPILDGSDSRGFITDEAGFLDVPKLVVYFKVDFGTERVVFLGLDSASTADDYPPSS